MSGLLALDGMPDDTVEEFTVELPFIDIIISSGLERVNIYFRLGGPCQQDNRQRIATMPGLHNQLDTIMRSQTVVKEAEIMLSCQHTCKTLCIGCFPENFIIHARDA